MRADGDDPSQREERLRRWWCPAAWPPPTTTCTRATGRRVSSAQLVAADGETLAEPKMVGQGLSFPEGLAAAPDGTLLVVETGTQDVVRLDPTTGETQCIAEDWPSPTATRGIPHGANVLVPSAWPSPTMAPSTPAAAANVIYYRFAEGKPSPLGRSVAGSGLLPCGAGRIVRHALRRDQVAALGTRVGMTRSVTGWSGSTARTLTASCRVATSRWTSR